MRDVAAEWTRKRTIVADAALTTSRINEAEQFFGVVIGDPRLIALMQQIAWAAAISGHEPKLQALGAFLGDAVARSDRLDETQLLVSALADIEKPHIAILEILTEAAADDDKYAARAAQQAEAARARAANPDSFTIPPHRDPGEAMAYEPGAWLPEDIQQKAPMDRRFVLACLSGLTATTWSLQSVPSTAARGSRSPILARRWFR